MKQLTPVQRATLDGALIIAGWVQKERRTGTIDALEPVLADMLEMEYERGLKENQ